LRIAALEHACTVGRTCSAPGSAFPKRAGQAVWFGGKTAPRETPIGSLTCSSNTVQNGSYREPCGTVRREPGFPRFADRRLPRIIDWVYAASWITRSESQTVKISIRCKELCWRIWRAASRPLEFTSSTSRMTKSSLSSFTPAIACWPSEGSPRVPIPRVLAVWPVGRAA